MAGTSPYVAHERSAEVDAWESIVTWRTLISADRTPSASLTVGVAEIAPGSSEAGALHHHADDEVYYLISGRGAVHLDGIEHSVEPGSVVFIPGGTRHFLRNTGDDVMKVLYAFAVDRFSDVEYQFVESTGRPGSAAHD